MAYELFYWSGLQGRGEFVRLAFEAAGTPYTDVALEPDGDARMMALLDDPGLATPPFAPPFLRDGDLVVAQVAAILQHVGPALGLVPDDAAGRIWTHQIQLTIADLVAEAHDVHHPIASSLHYEDQTAEAARRAKAFREERIPKFLGWFERVLARNPAGRAHLVGDRPTYADTSLFQVVEGLRYAFPNAMRRGEGDWPRVVALRDRVAALPGIAAYLRSGRRTPFNESGIFRRYPELDP